MEAKPDKVRVMADQQQSAERPAAAPAPSSGTPSPEAGTPEAGTPGAGTPEAGTPGPAPSGEGTSGTAAVGAGEPGAPRRTALRPPRLSGGDAYSSAVGVLKYLLPALAVGLVLLVVVWPRVDPTDPRFSLQLRDLMPGEPSNSIMLNARFDGIDEEGRPYRVTAVQASQRTEDERLIDLEQPTGDLLTEDGTWIALASQTGLYNKDERVLDLEGEVTLFHDQGYEMQTEKAKVYMEQGRVVGRRAVEARGPSGTIESEGLLVEDSGAVVIFTGKAHMVIYAEALKEGGSGAEPRLPDIGGGE